MIQFENCIKYFGKIILIELSEAKIICWVSGGAVRDYFSGINIKTNYDLFFPNQEEYDKTVKYFKDNGATVNWESDNGMKLYYKNKTFDLVKHFFIDPMDCIGNFDFTVSMFAVDKDKVYYGKSSFIDLAKRQLIFNKILYPKSTLSRSFRYYKKGYSMCLGEMYKLIEAIQSLPKEDEKQDTEESPEISSGDLMNLFLGID